MTTSSVRTFELRYLSLSLGLATVLSLGGGYWMARSVSSMAPQIEATASKVKSFDLQIRDSSGRAAFHPVFRVSKGDRVSIHVTSAQAGLLMIRGYTADGIPIAVGQTVTVDFVATVSGRYVLHLHGVDGSHREVAGLEILP